MRRTAWRKIDLKKDQYNLSKEELRRLRRKKEQRTAAGILLLLLLLAVLVLGGISFGVYSFLHREPAKEPEVTVEPEPVTEEPEPMVSENEPEEEVTVSVSENQAEDEEVTELTDEMKAAILDETIAGYLANMTLEQKVAGLFFVTPEGLTGSNDMTIAGSALSAALSDYPVGGLLLTQSNMESSEQFKEMIFSIKSFTGNEIFIGVEETGGEDSPFVASGLSEAVITDQKTIGESGENAGAYTAGIAIGNRMNEYGVNTVIGPLADVAYSESGYTSARSFGDDPGMVKDMVRNAVRGIEDQNIHACVKFFPGYGDVEKSPESARPVSNRTKEDIAEKDYPIYDDAIRGGADFIMVSQIAYKPITDDVPACLSSEVVTDMLRGELEYEGIIMTDYLDTHSLIMHYKHADAAVMAVQAGADMLFCPGDFKKAYNGILSAVEKGEITEERIDESLYRIYRVKYRDLIDYDAVAGLIPAGN